MKVIAAVGLGGLLLLGIGAGGVLFLASAVGATRGSTGQAVGDIPIELVPVYRAAAATCPLPTELLAAVGKVETDHGRSPLPGVKSGANSAGAEGPMQFLPDTWNQYGVDGDGDGTANVHSPVDSIFGAAQYLCANGGGADANGVRNALWNYNHSDEYIDDVLSFAETYRRGPYVLPVALDAVRGGVAGLNEPHHDYAAVDIPVPSGTPVVAVRGGVATRIIDGRCGWGVLVVGDDGNTYIYCHASQLLVRDGQVVATGDPIALSGGIPGTDGAGSSTGSHLHLGVSVEGQAICPQSLLVAWTKGIYPDPATAPSSGCSS